MEVWMIVVAAAAVLWLVLRFCRSKPSAHQPGNSNSLTVPESFRYLQRGRPTEPTPKRDRKSKARASKPNSTDDDTTEESTESSTVAALCSGGVEVVKFGRHGAPHTRKIHVKNGRIDWGSNSFSVEDVLKITTEANTEVLKRKSNQNVVQANQTISVVTAKRTLDVQVNSEPERDRLMSALCKVVEDARTGPNKTSRDVSQTTDSRLESASVSETKPSAAADHDTSNRSSSNSSVVSSTHVGTGAAGPVPVSLERESSSSSSLSSSSASSTASSTAAVAAVASLTAEDELALASPTAAVGSSAMMKSFTERCVANPYVMHCKIEPTAQERHAIAQFRSTALPFMQSHPDSLLVKEALASERCVMRFLIARQFDSKKAVTMFEDTVKWREAEKVDSILDEPNPLFLDIHKQFDNNGNHRFDKYGRPTHIEVIGRLDAAAMLKRFPVDDVVRQKVHLFEFKKRITMPPKGVDQMCNVLDLTGLGVHHLLPASYRFISKLSKINQDYNPEVLGKLYIINAPLLFSVAWRIIRPWLDGRTQAKIEIHRGDARDALLTTIDAESLPKMWGGQCECKGGCLFGSEEQKLYETLCLKGAAHIFRQRQEEEEARNRQLGSQEQVRLARQLSQKQLQQQSLTQRQQQAQQAQQAQQPASSGQSASSTSVSAPAAPANGRPAATASLSASSSSSSKR